MTELKTNFNEEIGVLRKSCTKLIARIAELDDESVARAHQSFSRILAKLQTSMDRFKTSFAELSAISSTWVLAYAEPEGGSGLYRPCFARFSG